MIKELTQIVHKKLLKWWGLKLTKFISLGTAVAVAMDDDMMTGDDLLDTNH